MPYTDLVDDEEGGISASKQDVPSSFKARLMAAGAVCVGLVILFVVLASTGVIGGIRSGAKGTPHPTESPTTAQPTGAPTTAQPTSSPTTASPTPQPTDRPTPSPTSSPTVFPPPDPNDFKLSFAAIGDWGVTDDGGHDSTTHGQPAGPTRDRNFNAQVNIANSMKAWARREQPSFVLSHGDNFYWTGMSTTTDPRWNTIFENVYNDPALHCPWYNVMGNHDLGGGSGMCGPSAWNAGYLCGSPAELTQALNNKINTQMNYRSPNNNRWRFGGPYYKVKHVYPPTGPEEFSIEIFNIDTNAAGNRLPNTCCQCYSIGGNCNNPGRGQPNCAPSDQYDACAAILERWWDESMSNLQRDLMASTATWKIVHNHYLTKHFTPAQEAEVLTILKAGGVHVFIGGHEHAEGHDLRDGIHFIENGGGGGAVMLGGTGNIWLENSYGWMGAKVSKYYMQIQFYNDQNLLRHCYNIPVGQQDRDNPQPFRC